MSIKDVAEEALTKTGKRMAHESAFVAFLLFVVVLLLGWFLYSNHLLQQQVIDMRVEEYKREVERFKRIDEWGKVLSEIKAEIVEMKASEARYVEMLREIRKNPCAQ